VKYSAVPRIKNEALVRDENKEKAQKRGRESKGREKKKSERGEDLREEGLVTTWTSYRKAACQREGRGGGSRYRCAREEEGRGGSRTEAKEKTS